MGVKGMWQVCEVVCAEPMKLEKSLMFREKIDLVFLNS